MTKLRDPTATHHMPGGVKMEFVGICLVTQNVPVLSRFYSKVLGIESEGDDVHVKLKTKGANMTIFTVEGMESLAPGCMQGAGYGSLTISFQVNDVDAEYERLKTLNVDFVKPPALYSWGTKSMWFRDPDGNIVNFFTVLTER